jgi:starvation-inducible DNA-binding protein
MSKSNTAEKTSGTDLVRVLSQLLADTYAIYLKTQNYHWNVTGPMFEPLHAMFERQYTELALAVDGIAERIRTLGSPAPGSFAEFSRLISLSEARKNLSGEEMVKDLADSHAAIVEEIKQSFDVAESAHDIASEDLLTQRIGHHEKTIWMLKSVIKK